MDSFIIKGILIGLLFGMPAGAVGAMTAQRTLNHGMKAGLLTGLGSSVSDCLYACIGAFGLTFVSDLLLRYQSIINLTGGCLILGMGIRMLQIKNDIPQITPNANGAIRMFVSSFVVGITNPAAILTFLFAFSWFGINEQTGIGEGIGLVCGVFIGTYLWWGILSGTVTLLKKNTKEKHLKRVNQLFGIILVILAVIMMSACKSQQDIDKNNISSAHSSSDQSSSDEVRQNTEETEEYTEKTEVTPGGTPKMMIEVGGQSFQAVIYENETVQKLQERLPMTLSMDELHGNEKYYYLDEGLPTNAENVGSIQTGDIMLFGSDCLVVFFDNFSTSYSYTRIGHIEDEDAFVKALTGGTVEVTFHAGE